MWSFTLPSEVDQPDILVKLLSVHHILADEGDDFYWIKSQDHQFEEEDYENLQYRTDCFGVNFQKNEQKQLTCISNPPKESVIA